jgi:hypothetical protein
MAVQLLTQPQLDLAVQQLLRNKDFRAANPHLSATEHQALLASPPTWPASPVFSPYAATHGQYSQSTQTLRTLGVGQQKGED